MLPAVYPGAAGLAQALLGEYLPPFNWLPGLCTVIEIISF